MMVHDENHDSDRMVAQQASVLEGQRLIQNKRPAFAANSCFSIWSDCLQDTKHDVNTSSGVDPSDCRQNGLETEVLILNGNSVPMPPWRQTLDQPGGRWNESSS